MRTQRLAVLITMAFFVVGAGLLVVNVFDSPQVNADAPTEEVGNETGPVVQERQGFNVSEFVLLVHEEVNQRRSEQDIDNLTHDRTLSFISQSHSVWMNETNTISEVDDEGRSPRERVEKAGYDCSAVSQNVLSASTTTLNEEEVAFGVVERWWLDKSTRSSILSQDHRSHGVGAIHTDDDKLYVTQIMC